MTVSGMKPRSFGAAWKALRIIAGFSLVYYAWIMFDLVTHPFSQGSNGAINPYLFRWLSALGGTFTVVVAIFILRRLPGNRIGFLLFLYGVGAAGWSHRLDFDPRSIDLIANLFNFYFFVLAFPALTALLFHFPSGQIFPIRMTHLAWGLVVFQGIDGILSVLAVPSFQNGMIHNPVYIPVLFPLAGLLNSLIPVTPLVGVISLVLRYRAGTQREKTQIKWLVWLGIVAICLSFIGPILNIPSDQPDNLPVNILKIINFIFWQAFPATAIGIALLRYRLWDIDLIIRRSLVYGVLSAALALVYFGGVTLFQWIFTRLTGQQSPAGIVISTLAIVVLFAPLRRQVQAFIDMRFYRRKYDAARAVEEFSSATRREVELDRLTTSLVSVIDETVQPAQVSVWIRPSNRRLTGEK